MPGLKVAFLSSELAPFAKTGGLADVSAALPRALEGLGCDVRVFLPRYGTITVEPEQLRRLDSETLRLALGTLELGYSVWQAEIPRSGVPVYLIDCPPLYDRPSIYTTDEDEPLRFIFLCRAALETCQRLAFRPDVLHCNDWQAALAPLLLRTRYGWDRLFQRTKTFLSIHNIGYQGEFSSNVFELIGVDDPSLFDPDDLRAGRLNFLKTGIHHADGLGTVSPTYAREIQTPDYGMGLEDDLRQRSERLVGILNGVDYHIWNPHTDQNIPFRYSEKSLWRKTKNKNQLLSELGLAPADSRMLVGMVTRLSEQKGIELVETPLAELLEEDALRLVVLGSGERRYEEFFDAIERRYPRAACFYRGFNDELAHYIEAAADVFLMPSRYEPCGLNQMYSLKYGTVPVVRRTGGLADSVRQFDPDKGEGTGFVFEHYTANGVRWALRTALGCHRDPHIWRRIMLNGMNEDFSWEHQAKLYVEHYRRLVPFQPKGPK